jgi:ABC-type dipeptide/oligopeptide/nickel transport system permease component
VSEAQAIAPGPLTARPRGRLGGGARYMLGRLGQGLLVVFGAITISFLLVHVTGNPAQVLAGGTLPPKEVAALSHELGYDKPLLQQYADYVGGVAHGDFGDSFRYRSSAASLVLTALPNTLLLVGLAILLATALAIATALYSVLHSDSRFDRWLRRALMVFQGIPDFWLCLMLVLVFGVELRWVPTIGFTGVTSLILPVVTLALPLVSSFVRLLRANLLDLGGSDFMVALRAKGMSEREIMWRHGLRNALVPFLTYLALQAGWLIGGTIIIESIFVWPGVGLVLLSAVQARDLTVIQAVVVIIAISFVLLNLLVDLLVMWLDPRTRTRSA